MKTWHKWILVIGIVLIIAGGLLWLNATTVKCKIDTHNYNNQTNTCYYQSETCLEDENYDGQYCFYEAKDFLSNKWLVGLIILCIICGVLFMVIKLWKGTNPHSTFQILNEFDSKDFVNPNVAKDIVIKEFVQKNKIYHYEDKLGFHYKKGAIRITNEWETFQKKNYEWFLQFEAEITEGEEIGIFTFLVSLSRGEDWIKGGNYRTRHVSFDDYKEQAIKRPLYQLKDRVERQAETLLQQGMTEEAQKVMSTSSPQESSDVSPEEREAERELNSQINDKRRIENQRMRGNYSRRNPRW